MKDKENLSEEETLEENNDETQNDEENQEDNQEDTQKSNEEEANAEPELDFEAELEKEKARREKAEKALTKIRLENKSKDEDPEEYKEDKEDIAEIVSKAIDEKFSALRSDVQSQQIDAEIAKHTQDPNAKELIKEKLKSFPSTGDLAEDIDNIWLIINKNRIKAQLKEVDRGQSKAGNGSGAGQKENNSSQPPISEAMKAVMKRQNGKYDPKTKRIVFPKFSYEYKNGEWEKV